MSLMLEKVWKSYRQGARVIPVLQGFDMVVNPGARVAVLGVTGTGKSTIMRHLAGTEICDSGKIRRDLRTSWVIPNYSFFSHYGSGVANVRFVARYFGMEEDTYLRRVLEFSGIGERINDKLDKISGLMRGQLAIAMALCIDTDVYLFDDSIGFGSNAFRQKCSDAISGLVSQGKAVVIGTSAASIVTPFCDEAYVIDNGRSVYHADLAEGIRHMDELAAMNSEQRSQTTVSPTSDTGGPETFISDFG